MITISAEVKSLAGAEVTSIGCAEVTSIIKSAGVSQRGAA